MRWSIFLFVLSVACGESHSAGDPDAARAGDASLEDAGSPRTDAGRPRDGGSTASDAGARDASTRTDAGPDSGLPPRVVSCSDAPPGGAPSPPPLAPYSGGTCPTLAPGRNTIQSGGASREFILAVPAGLAGDEQLPVLFLWHWLGGSADDFYTRGEVQAAADADRFLAVIPEEKGDVTFRWPFSPLESAARRDEELRFFDDMLACVAEQYSVNRSCVGSVGVSAGALWTSQLASHRSEQLSSFVSLSGGTGGSLVRPWGGASHRIPAIVLWGGPTDFCGVNFETASRDLEDNLTADGHFFVECIHDCGHAEPPLEPPEGLSTYTAIWRFVLDHPYWLRAGESPYLATGLPDAMPDWCGIGAGSATMRTGECPGSGCI